MAQIFYACMKFNSLEQAVAYLEQYIPHAYDDSPPAKKFARAQKLMEFLGNPQDALNVVHVAGTSGKGSTCTIISSLLHAHGFKVGLTVSPHLINITERSQINNHNMGEMLYLQYLSEIIPAIEKLKKTEFGAPSFFEITMAHAFYSFYKEKVEYAVIETGLGGRFDASNTVTRKDKLCVITSIGYDHMDFLGNTLSKIASEKAGIIQKENRVLSAPQEVEAAKIIESVVQDQKGSVRFIDVQSNIRSSLRGSYQKINISLALAAVYELSKRDGFQYASSSIAQSLMNIHFPARFDIRQIDEKTVIFDGAHNPQKMEAFVTSLKESYPDQKFDFLIAFSTSKDFGSMLDIIIPVANTIVITSFEAGNQGMHIQAQDPKNILDALVKKDFKQGTIVMDAKKALQNSLRQKGDFLVITGSLYLQSELYPYIKDM